MSASRPLPPPIKPRNPACPLCTEETHWQDDGYACEACCAWWPERVTGEEPGEWLDPDAPQCDEIVQPYLDNTWIKDDDPRKHSSYRCLLNEGHREHKDMYGNPVQHANDEMTCFAKGWAG